MGTARAGEAPARANRIRSAGRGLLITGLGCLLASGVGHAVFADSTWDPADNAILHPAHQGATNPGFGSAASCPAPPEGAAGDWAWHFVLPTDTHTFTSVDVDFSSYGFHEHVPFV